LWFQTKAVESEIGNRKGLVCRLHYINYNSYLPQTQSSKDKKLGKSKLLISSF